MFFDFSISSIRIKITGLADSNQLKLSIYILIQNKGSGQEPPPIQLNDSRFRQ